MKNSSNSKAFKAKLLLTTIGFLLSTTIAFDVESDGTKPLTLASHSPDSTHHLHRAKIILGRALTQLGYSLTIRRCEPNLCTQLVNHNRVDGELIRVAIYHDRVPTLLMVKEPVLSVTWSAYSLNPAIQVQNWQQIVNSNFKISYLDGLPFLDHHLLGKVSPERLVKLKHWMVGLESLRSGKADIFITADHVDSISIRNSELFYFRQIQLFEQVPLHTFLNSRHQQLAKKLSAIMAKMKTNGEISAIDQALFIAR